MTTTTNPRVNNAEKCFRRRVSKKNLPVRPDLFATRMFIKLTRKKQLSSSALEMSDILIRGEGCVTIASISEAWFQ